MNVAQELWWKQSVSDYAVFEMMRSNGVHPCHVLHYLQMATEKIAKASFWSRNTAPALMIRLIQFTGEDAWQTQTGTRRVLR